MTIDELHKKATYLTSVINKQIQLTDDKDDLKVLAVLMMNKSRDLLDEHVGVEKRKFLFKEFT